MSLVISSSTVGKDSLLPHSRRRFYRSQGKTKTIFLSCKAVSIAEAPAYCPFVANTNISSSFPAVILLVPCRVGMRPGIYGASQSFAASLPRPATNRQCMCISLPADRSLPSSVTRLRFSQVHRAKIIRLPLTHRTSFGTCIKLYCYRWNKKSLFTTEGRYERWNGTSTPSPCQLEKSPRRASAMSKLFQHNAIGHPR